METHPEVTTMLTHLNYCIVVPPSSLLCAIQPVTANLMIISLITVGVSWQQESEPIRV